MTKAAISLVAATAFAAGVFVLPAPAKAQGVVEIVVYGNDPCPRSTADEIVVCARKPEAERYRIPERFRTTGPRQLSQPWAHRARALETVGRTGINSCSPVGPAGFTGCLEQVIRQARNEAQEEATGATPPPE
ncbi:MAG TPA: hypothetical protein VNH53_04115 [Sphingomicrobium sp.]|nr:hypothetical protein [Sphingomicrobium sp.]